MQMTQQDLAKLLARRKSIRALQKAAIINCPNDYSFHFDERFASQIMDRVLETTRNDPAQLASEKSLVRKVVSEVLFQNDEWAFLDYWALKTLGALITFTVN